jgi:uncharacterized protein (TIGR00369 family)
VLAKKRPPGWRVEKNVLTRQRLFEAAIHLVGEVGHSGATIHRITTRARIAHGTFYNYFTSQQDIFDQILPYLGGKMLAHLDERLDPADSFINRQDAFMVAFDDFVLETPGFYRVVAEGEVFAPKAFRIYIATTIEWLTRRFTADRHLASYGSIDPQRLEIVALMVIAATNYINMRFCDWMGEGTRIPGWAVETFHKFVQGGVMAVSGQTVRAEAAAQSIENGTPSRSGKAAKTAKAAGQAAARIAEQAVATVESAAPRGLVKFVPRSGPVDTGFVGYSAQSVQLEFRHTSLAQGHVVLELDIDRRTLNSRGTVAGGTLSALVEVAAATALADRAEQHSAETINLTCAMIRPAMEGVLVAEARMENAGRHIRFCTVRITLDTKDGPLIANATVTLRVIE